MCCPDTNIRTTFTATFVCVAGLWVMSTGYVLKSPSYTSANPPLSRNSPTMSRCVTSTERKESIVSLLDESLRASSSKTEVRKSVSSVGEVRKLASSKGVEGEVCEWTSLNGVKERESTSSGGTEECVTDEGSKGRLRRVISFVKMTRNMGGTVNINMTAREGRAIRTTRAMATDGYQSSLCVSSRIGSMSVRSEVSSLVAVVRRRDTRRLLSNGWGLW